MVAVTVNGPLGEYRVGVLGVEDASESLIVGVVDDGPAVILTGENGSGL